MLKINVNAKYTFEIETNKQGTTINSNPVSVDVHKINEHSFHLLYQNKSYLAEIIRFNKAEKTCTVKVNSNTYNLTITDQFDELLHQLGIDNLNTAKISELKAPMPGLVLKVLVAEGDEVKKGDNLLVLEAMKMENIIKSPADVRIKSIKINPSDKVEKNQVMIVFG
ncbi:MAG: acetyl-CoA carboxylase biotin carboxyl carrier protein subunit [Daejeonella sp.]